MNRMSFPISANSSTILAQLLTIPTMDAEVALEMVQHLIYAGKYRNTKSGFKIQDNQATLSGTSLSCTTGSKIIISWIVSEATTTVPSFVFPLGSSEAKAIFETLEKDLNELLNCECFTESSWHDETKIPHNANVFWDTEEHEF